jgi:hypothetical protein
MKHIEPKWVWRTMPIIPVVCSVVTSLEGDASLYLLAFSFFAAKCMDYSLRGVVNEMVCNVDICSHVLYECRYSCLFLFADLCPVGL